MKLRSSLLSAYKSGMKAVIQAAWVTRVTNILGTPSSAWNGYTLRQVLPASSFVPATSIRLSFSVPGAATATVAKMFVQEASGTGYNFTSTPIPVTVLGATSFVIPAGTDSLVTDEIFLSISGSNNILVSMFFPSGGASSNIMYAADFDVLSTRGYFKGGDEAALVTATGYSTSARKYLVSKVETR